MYPNAGSMSNGILGVVGDISEMERSVDVHSQVALVVVSSLSFLIPTFITWRMNRLWHSFLFGMLTVICASYHYCSADGNSPQHVSHAGRQLRCSPDMSRFLTHAFFLWVYFCFLQMAFLVMGPEDPQLQWLQAQSPGNPSCTIPIHAPSDAVVAARFVPLAVLLVFHLFHASWDSEEIHWQSLLLNEILMLVCCAAFWLHKSRQFRAADVLVRFKFWHRCFCSTET
jgi:hypothetical protein